MNLKVTISSTETYFDCVYAIKNKVCMCINVMYIVTVVSITWETYKKNKSRFFNVVKANEIKSVQHATCQLYHITNQCVGCHPRHIIISPTFE